MLKCSLSSDGSFSFQWILAQKYMYFCNPLKPRWRFVLGFIIALSTPWLGFSRAMVFWLHSSKYCLVNAPIKQCYQMYKVELNFCFPFFPRLHRCLTTVKQNKNSSPLTDQKIGAILLFTSSFHKKYHSGWDGEPSCMSMSISVFYSARLQIIQTLCPEWVQWSDLISAGNREWLGLVTGEQHSSHQHWQKLRRKTGHLKWTRDQGPDN